MKDDIENKIPSIAHLEGIEALNIEPEEAFVFSRVDGKSSVREIGQMLGFDSSRVWKLLSRLVDAGFLTVTEKTVKTLSRVGGKKSILDSLDAEESDVNLKKIPRQFRNEIRLRHGALADQTHYEVLGVDSKASADAIKKEYFRFVKEFHPDRFFGQEVGHYRQKLEELFGRITQSFEVLNDPNKRKAYDRSLAAKKTDTPKNEPTEEPIHLSGKNLIERLALAKQHFERAEKEEMQGKEISAANLYQLAYRYDPANKGYERAAHRTKPLLQRHRSKDLYSRGVDALNRGNLGDATAYLEEALQLNQRKRECYRELASIYSRNKLSLERAKDLGTKAVEFFPNDADVHVTMGYIYKELGELNLAKKEYKLAAKLDATNKAAKEGLEQLKGK